MDSHLPSPRAARARALIFIMQSLYHIFLYFVKVGGEGEMGYDKKIKIRIKYSLTRSHLAD